jgi:phage baseplate assembly protein W
MPREVKFKDLSISMGINPVTKDVLNTTGETAVKRALYNIISTRKGERFYRPDLGSDIANYLFEPLDAATASLISQEIEYVIRKYEPRVDLVRVDVDLNYERNGFDVVLAFEIIGVNTDVQVREIDFFLERTR